MYKYPANPTQGVHGMKAWSEVYPDFQTNYRPACNAIGSFINANQGKKVVAAIEESYKEKGFNNWDAIFNSNIGIDANGSRITQYCPQKHRTQFDCIEASRRMTQISIPAIEKVIEILGSLECMPEDGYAHCRVAGTPNIHIYGTDKVSVSAMSNIDHIYTTMTDLFKTEYPASKFEGYKIYVTNEETIAELDALYPINRMWTTGSGDGTRDWLRGGTGPDWLWITEQMICKTGVVTRNKTSVEDDTERTFDQVVHEFGHAIDFRFDIKSSEFSMYQNWGNPVEGFPWGIQHWFGTPQGSFIPGELTVLNKIFSEREGFSCEYYSPE